MGRLKHHLVRFFFLSFFLSKEYWCNGMCEEGISTVSKCRNILQLYFSLLGFKRAKFSDQYKELIFVFRTLCHYPGGYTLPFYFMPVEDLMHLSHSECYTEWYSLYHFTIAHTQYNLQVPQLHTWS